MEVLWWDVQVVYGLFGYIWIKCKYDPGDGFFPDPFASILIFGFLIYGLQAVARSCQLGRVGYWWGWRVTGRR